MSDPPTDGELDFDSLGYEKGMQQGALPGDLQEDITSSYHPTNYGNIVKLPVKRPYNPKMKSPNPSKAAKKKSKSKNKGTNMFGLNKRLVPMGDHGI